MRLKSLSVDRHCTLYVKRTRSDWSEPWVAAPAIVDTSNNPFGWVGLWSRTIVLDAGGQPLPSFGLFTNPVRDEGQVVFFDGGKWNMLPALMDDVSVPAMPALVRAASGPPVLGAYYLYFAGDEGALPRVGLYRGGNDYGPSTPQAVSCTRCVRNPGGTDELFGVESGPMKLWHLSQDASGDALVATEVPGADNRVYYQLLARRMPSGLIELFSTDYHKRLHRAVQDPSLPSGWSEFMPIGTDLLFANIAWGSAADGSSELFAIDLDGALWRLWKDAPAADGKNDPEWRIDAMEVSDASSIEDVDAYVAQVVVHDPGGSPLPGAAVRLFADDGVWLEVNGSSTFVDAARPWTGTTNAQGQLLMTVPTDALGVPALGLWFGDMPEADRVSIDLSANIQARLSGTDPKVGIDASVLLSAMAKDADGNPTQPLLPSNQRDPALVHSIADNINASMKMLHNAGTHDAVARCGHRRARSAARRSSARGSWSTRSATVSFPRPTGRSTRRSPRAPLGRALPDDPHRRAIGVRLSADIRRALPEFTLDPKGHIQCAECRVWLPRRHEKWRLNGLSSPRSPISVGLSSFSCLDGLSVITPRARTSCSGPNPIPDRIRTFRLRLGTIGR